MAKFKVGDKVTIKRELNQNIECLWGVCDDMVKYAGAIATIEIVYLDSYRIDLDSRFYCWEDCMFEEELLIEVKKKEGNEMIESLNLIDVYANRMTEKLEEEFEEKTRQLRENNEINKKYEEILEETKTKIEELHMSQFTDEEKEQVLKGMPIGDKKILVVYEEISVNIDGAYIQDNTEEQTKLNAEYAEKHEELRELIKTVKAHVGIAKTKEEVEDILIKYGILNKKGILTVE